MVIDFDTITVVESGSPTETRAARTQLFLYKEGEMKKRWSMFATKGVPEKMIEMAQDIASFSNEAQLGFAKAWFNEIAEEQELIDKLLNLVSRAALKSAYPLIEEKIEELLKDDYDLRPSEAAYRVRRQLALPAKLRPLTISIARRVKNKLRARKRREKEAQNE